MSGTIVSGPRTWAMEADEEGYREYKVIHLVRMSSTRDGPYFASLTPGLPVTGSLWNFGNDVDALAWCTRKKSVSIHEEKEGDPATYYRVEHTFTTRPDKVCQDEEVDNPLLMPVKKSGSFLSKPKAAIDDQYGPLLYSSHEQITGPLVEFDNTKAMVNLEMNVPSLRLDLLTAAMNHVNDAELWGMPRRTVKLSTIGWEEKFYGQCYAYYTWHLGFEIDPETFDRFAVDQGTKVLNGYWDRDTGSATWGTWKLRSIAGAAPDNTDPTHFIRYKDWNGENTRVLLDGRGTPAKSIKHVVATGTSSWDVGTPTQGAFRHIVKYDEYNFFLLGVPILLGA